MYYFSFALCVGTHVLIMLFNDFIIILSRFYYVIFISLENIPVCSLLHQYHHMTVISRIYSIVNHV